MFVELRSESEVVDQFNSEGAFVNEFGSKRH